MKCNFMFGMFCIVVSVVDHAINVKYHALDGFIKRLNINYMENVIVVVSIDGVVNFILHLLNRYNFILTDYDYKYTDRLHNT